MALSSLKKSEISEYYYQILFHYCSYLLTIPYSEEKLLVSIRKGCTDTLSFILTKNLKEPEPKRIIEEITEINKSEHLYLKVVNSLVSNQLKYELLPCKCCNYILQGLEEIPNYYEVYVNTISTNKKYIDYLYEPVFKLIRLESRRIFGLRVLFSVNLVISVHDFLFRRNTKKLPKHNNKYSQELHNWR